MAAMERMGGRSRNQYRRIEDRAMYSYVEGTAARQLASVPAPRETERRTTSAAAKKNRERALQMNLPYVLFLTAAAIVTMFVCVNFLQLRASATRLQKEVTALETQLDAAVLENNSDYNRIMTGVDMDHVKRVAMDELGMVYAKKSQIVTYALQESDYVRQYAEIPAE